MNLLQKLVEVRKEVVQFSKDSKSFGYKYVSGSQAIAKIRSMMDELGLILIPNIGMTENETYDYTNKNGETKTDFIVKGDMSYIWINAEDGEKLEIPWKLYGAQDDISKAYGSALTYSERYFILKFFQAPTDELDPDARDTQNRVNNKPSYPPKTFKSEQGEQLKCEGCGAEVKQNVANFSKQKFGKVLCFKCKKIRGTT